MRRDVYSSEHMNYLTVCGNETTTMLFKNMSVPVKVF